jgi:hypothetical protein
MNIDFLELLNKFNPIDDVETEQAIYKTRVPSVAPEAYLTVIFKPAPAAVRHEAERRLCFPAPLVNFYSQWNGAHLFINGIHIYGCVPQGQLLNRRVSLSLPPFNIETVNREFAKVLDGRNLVCIGSYGYDTSLVCMDRHSLEIDCFKGKDITVKRRVWTGLEQWITSEVHRIATFFDDFGNCLVDQQRLLPG